MWLGLLIVKTHMRINPGYAQGHDASGFRFYTNYGSQKSQELDANPNIAMCFFWATLERQVRGRSRAGAALAAY